MTEQQLDRTIYEKLRLAAVSLGHLPDITSIGNAAFPNALKNLADPVMIWGVSTAETRGQKTDAQITVNRSGQEQGSTSFFGIHAHNKVGTSHYNKVTLPPLSHIVSYDIRSFSNDIRMDRICRSIIRKAFPSITALQAIDESAREFTGESFHLFFNGLVDLSTDDFFESSFRYYTSEVFLEEPTDEGQSSILTEVNYELRQVDETILSTKKVNDD